MPALCLGRRMLSDLRLGYVVESTWYANRMDDLTSIRTLYYTSFVFTNLLTGVGLLTPVVRYSADITSLTTLPAPTRTTSTIVIILSR